MTADRATVESINAVTLASTDMAASIEFYEKLGFDVHHRGPGAFTSFTVGAGHLNLCSVQEAPTGFWGRVIFYVSDVDAVYRRAVAAGFMPDTAPADAPWGERYFHLRDPDGHELSFARPLEDA